MNIEKILEDKKDIIDVKTFYSLFAAKHKGKLFNSCGEYKIQFNEEDFYNFMEDYKLYLTTKIKSP